MPSKDEIGFFLRWSATLKMRTLETERLVLRPFHQDDLRDVVGWTESSSALPTEADAQGFLDFCFRAYREWGIGPWAMLLKKTGVIVGDCSFCHVNFKDFGGEINYYVAPRHRGQGLAPEALNALLGFGFAELGLSRIQARCAPDNPSSERVMQKVGMTFQRMLERAVSSQDAGREEKLYAMAQQDFRALPLPDVPSQIGPND